MRRSFLAVIPLAALLALGACHKPPAKKETPEQQVRVTRVVRIQALGITGGVAAAGDLVPREEAAVLPEVSGYRVSRVLVDVGSYVRKGQVLVEMDPALIQSQLAQQQALAAQAEVQALQAESQAAAVKGLDNQGVISQEQIDQRRFQARAARASANAQTAALRDIRTRAGKLQVAAPVSGLILSRTVRPGDLSASGSEPWFRIARDGEVELQAQVSDSDLANIRIGQPARVNLPNGAVVQGNVRLISPQIDPQTKLGSVRIRLPVRSDIRAGGFGRAVFGDAGTLTPAVPETAIRYDADGASVMVVGADNKVKRAPVTAGQRGGGLVQLVKGPPVGTRVVRSAGAFLLDGDVIRPQETATTPASPRK